MEKRRRGRPFVYRLKNEDQVPQQVGKTFFLAILGYHPANDSLVLSVMGNEIGNEMIGRDQIEEECKECLLQDQHIKNDHDMDCLQCQRQEKNNNKNTPAVWHEGTAGQSAAEITLAYVIGLEKERDICHSILWVDNCSAQNKNWCLLSSLVCLVNGDTTSMEDITLEYFEKGHTFMSTDRFHHGVEQEIVLEEHFEDFVCVVSSSNSSKAEGVEMKNADVLNWKDCTKVGQDVSDSATTWLQEPALQTNPCRCSLYRVGLPPG
ncbi:unnamed protein product [Leuciscus chuanchicus]